MNFPFKVFPATKRAALRAQQWKLLQCSINLCYRLGHSQQLGKLNIQNIFHLSFPPTRSNFPGRSVNLERTAGYLFWAV